METILDRIEQFAENQGVKIGAFEKKIGASKGVLSRAIAQKTDIQAKWLVKIVENYPQIDANWLLTGEGSMYRSPAVMNEVPPPDRDEVVRLLREKVADQQKIIGLLEESTHGGGQRRYRNCVRSGLNWHPKLTIIRGGKHI